MFEKPPDGLWSALPVQRLPHSATMMSDLHRASRPQWFHILFSPLAGWLWPRGRRKPEAPLSWLFPPHLTLSGWHPVRISCSPPKTPALLLRAGKGLIRRAGKARQEQGERRSPRLVLILDCCLGLLARQTRFLEFGAFNCFTLWRGEEKL